MRKGPTDIEHWRRRLASRVKNSDNAGAYIREFDHAVAFLSGDGKTACGQFCFYYHGGDKTIAEAMCPPDKGCRRENLRLTCAPCAGLSPEEVPSATDLGRDANLAPFRPADVVLRPGGTPLPHPVVVGNTELTAQHAVAASQFPRLAAASGDASPALEANDADLLDGVDGNGVEEMDEDL